MNEVAVELDCDWPSTTQWSPTAPCWSTTPDRFGQPTALGLDETLFCRRGNWRTQSWSTSIVDVGTGRLLALWLAAALWSPASG